MTQYRITVDRSLCSGFGSCVDTAPTSFQLDDSGLATVSVRETDNPAVLDAADACPMGAILVEEVAAA
jgi:ferredoxin